MEELKIKKFEIDEIDEITLLSVEEAEKIPQSILSCGNWWWLRSPGHNRFLVVGVNCLGVVFKLGFAISFDCYAVRPAFKISSLESEIGKKITVNKTLCTVIDKGLVLADCSICKHRFDSKSNVWETSEIKAFIESDEFKAMI